MKIYVNYDYKAVISYIIPAKNEEKYIGECVRSCLNQEVSESTEVIVVDNGSTDSTSEIVKARYPQAKMVFEERSGINFARQKGLEASRGDIVVFVDADVRLPADWTKRVVKELRGSPDTVAISGPYRYYDAASRYIMWITDLSQLIFSFYSTVANFLFDYNTVLIAGDVAIKKEALDKIGGLDTRFVFYREDVDTAKRLNRVGRVVFRWRYEVFSSARRFNKIGLLRLGGTYLYHYFGALFTRKPADEPYDIVR